MAEEPVDDDASGILGFYNENAQAYDQSTVGLNMADLYERFLALIRPGAHILDAGCGPGRDTLYFLQHGFQVTAFDGSKRMVEIAAQRTGLDVQYLTFEDFVPDRQFDAIWASASLLHVRSCRMSTTLRRFARGLRAEGVFYLSYKLGIGETVVGNRRFTNYEPESFRVMIAELVELEIVALWVAPDLRSNRGSERWLNVILRKTSGENA